MQHILIVEDDASMRELVTLHLTENNFLVTVAADAADAKAMKENFDLIVLDTNLPKMNGLEFEGLEHTVNAHTNRLRIKIETDLDNLKYILKTWGVGYRFLEHV